jgi:hypothetical protein
VNLKYFATDRENAGTLCAARAATSTAAFGMGVRFGAGACDARQTRTDGRTDEHTRSSDMGCDYFDPTDYGGGGGGRAASVTVGGGFGLERVRYEKRESTSGGGDVVSRSKKYDPPGTRRAARDLFFSYARSARSCVRFHLPAYAVDGRRLNRRRRRRRQRRDLR